MFLFAEDRRWSRRRTRCPGATTRCPCPSGTRCSARRSQPPFPEGIEQLVVGMGCFWGAERIFWQARRRLHDGRRLRGRLHAEPDVRGGLLRPHRPHRGRARRLRPGRRSRSRSILRLFWEGHDPTQGMRQGNDVGTQYRSAIYWTTRRSARPPRRRATCTRSELARAGYGEITTEIAEAGPFYYAEDYHQQYLAKNPNGYCGLGGTGVACPSGSARNTAGSGPSRPRRPTSRSARVPSRRSRRPSRRSRRRTARRCTETERGSRNTRP